MKKAICLFDCLIGLAVLRSPAFAGEIQGRMLITRSLTKKRVTVPATDMVSISLTIPLAEGD